MARNKNKEFLIDKDRVKDLKECFEQTEAYKWYSKLSKEELDKLTMDWFYNTMFNKTEASGVYITWKGIEMLYFMHIKGMLKEIKVD